MDYNEILSELDNLYNTGRMEDAGAFLEEQYALAVSSRRCFSDYGRGRRRRRSIRSETEGRDFCLSYSLLLLVVSEYPRNKFTSRLI